MLVCNIAIDRYIEHARRTRSQRLTEANPKKKSKLTADVDSQLLVS